MPSKQRASQAAPSAQTTRQARTHHTHPAHTHPAHTHPPHTHTPRTRTTHAQSGSRSRGAAKPGSGIGIYTPFRLQQLPFPNYRAELCSARWRFLHVQGSSTPSTKLGWQVTAAVCRNPCTLRKAHPRAEQLRPHLTRSFTLARLVPLPNRNVLV